MSLKEIVNAHNQECNDVTLDYLIEHTGEITEDLNNRLNIKNIKLDYIK